MLWTFENAIFKFFANFWAIKSKRFSGKVRQSIQNYLNQNFVIRNFLENGFGANLSSKMNVLSVWKRHFSVFFARFWVTKLKPFSGKAKQSVQNYFNQNFVIGTFRQNGFGGFLSSKTNVLPFEMVIFQFFADFLVTK